MRKTYLLVLILFVATTAFAQAKITTVDYQKAMQPAVETDFPFPEKTVTKALENKFEKMGYKGKENKGFVVYKGVRMAQLGPDAYDLYFKTTRKSKKEKDATSLTMMVSAGYEKFISDDNSLVLSHAKSFLDSQLVIVGDYDLELQVSEQDNEVKKADKKMNSLVEDAADLEKRKKKLENEIEENLKAQKNQKAEAEKQQNILSTLKSKRRQ